MYRFVIDESGVVVVEGLILYADDVRVRWLGFRELLKVASECCLVGGCRFRIRFRLLEFQWEGSGKFVNTEPQIAAVGLCCVLYRWEDNFFGD